MILNAGCIDKNNLILPNKAKARPDGAHRGKSLETCSSSVKVAAAIFEKKNPHSVLQSL
jgi:hypothetical protein